MLNDIVTRFVLKQLIRRTRDQWNDPIMVGDLPLKRAGYLDRVLSGAADEFSFGFLPESRDLEAVQVLLHLAVQEDDAIVLERDAYSWDSTLRRWFLRRAPFHEEIRGHWEQFVEKLGDKTELDHFEITNISLPPAPFFADNIAPILQNSSLMRLDLKNCNLTSSEFQGVAQLMKNRPTLVSLCLSRNEIENVADAKALSAAISKHKGLSFVDLSKCGLGESDEILSLFLKGGKKLNGLDLSGNGFGPKSLALIAKFLSTHKSITILNLGENVFDDESVTALDNAVKKNKTLEELSLASTRDVSTNISLSTRIQRSLVLNDKLMHIDLSGNKLQANGAKLIAKHLKKNPPLSILSLVGCGLPSKTAEVLCSALKRNTSLVHLDLKRNNFNERAVPFFVDALRKNSTLITLNMCDNNIRVQSGRKELIKRALCDPTSLQTIAESNHTCLVTLNKGKNGNFDTNEIEFRNINSLENEGQKIRFKVVAALFTLKTIKFNPRDFQNIPLELMPRLLELVQQELGFGRYGREVWKAPIRAKGSNPCLTRVFEIMHGWSMLPSLFARGPGKLKKKAAKKRRHAFAFKEADDEEWTPKSRY